MKDGGDGEQENDQEQGAESSPKAGDNQQRAKNLKRDRPNQQEWSQVFRHARAFHQIFRFRKAAHRAEACGKEDQHQQKPPQNRSSAFSNLVHRTRSFPRVGGWKDQRSVQSIRNATIAASASSPQRGDYDRRNDGN